MDPIIRDIVNSERFQDGLSTMTAELGRSRSEIERRAVRAFGEMLTRHDPAADAVYKGIGALLSRRYRIDADQEALRNLRELDESHALLWLPSHRSYLDTFYLEQVAQEAGIRPAFVLGGDNLDFWPIGPILRRSGVLFIRRSTKDDPIYRFALRTYLGHIVATGQNLTWSIEGGRSRTGKLRPPRYGALRYVVDAVRNSQGPDPMIVPVSVVYEQLAEVTMMAAEARGAEKTPEGLGWLLRFARTQPERMSTVRLDFGEPMPLRARIEELDRDPRAEGQQVERLALEVCHRVNRVTPAIPTAVVTFALLGAERALTLDEITEALTPITAYIASHPTTPHMLGAEVQDPSWLRGTLDRLTDAGVVERFAGGPETVWRIAPEQHLVAAFYRNTLVHLLVNRAIAELAVFQAREHSTEDLRESIWNHAMSLRQLLKFDFFFATRAEFNREIIADVTLIDPAWEGRGVSEPIVTRSEIDRWFEKSKPHLAHIVLRPFFDAYMVVADQLANWPHDREVDREELLERSLGYGQQLVLQGRLHSAESVTLELFRNAVKLADNKGLLKGTGADLAERRLAFAERLRGIVDDLDSLARMQRAR
jgi:glycerol-3-phosphate O-acyltransferase